MVSAFVPRPDIAYLLDADPADARARKPQYPAEFMHLCRNAYLRLAGILGGMTVIPPVPLAEAQRQVEAAFVGALPEAQAGAPHLDPASAA